MASDRTLALINEMKNESSEPKYPATEKVIQDMVNAQNGGLAYVPTGRPGVKDSIRKIRENPESAEKEIQNLRTSLEIERRTGTKAQTLFENFNQYAPVHEDSWWTQLKKNIKNTPQRFIKTYGSILRIMGENDPRGTVQAIDTKFQELFGDEVQGKVDTENKMKPGVILKAYDAYSGLSKYVDPISRMLFFPEEELPFASEQAEELLKGGLAEQGTKIAREAQTKLEENAPITNRGTMKYYVSAATDSVLNNAAFYTAGLLSRNPGIVIGGIFTQSAASKYQDVRELGFDPSTATLSAIIEGGAEAIPEMLPMSIYFKPINKRAAKPVYEFVKRVLMAEMAEIPTEEMTTIAQMVSDKLILDQDITYAEAVEQIIETAIVTAIATAPMSAGAQLMAPRVEGTEPTREEQDIERIQQVHEEAKQRNAEVEAGLIDPDVITPEMEKKAESLIPKEEVTEEDIADVISAFETETEPEIQEAIVTEKPVNQMSQEEFNDFVLETIVNQEEVDAILNDTDVSNLPADWNDFIDRYQEEQERFKVLQEEQIQEDEEINSITREEAGRLMAEGDESLAEHIKSGLAEGRSLTSMQDALRNQLMQEVSKSLDLTPEERAQVKENLNKAEKIINEALKRKEGGFIYIPSKQEISEALDRVKESLSNPEQAINDLVQVGQDIYNDGIRTFKEFATRMKDLLGSTWNNFKDYIGRAWNILVALNARLGERGSVPIPGKPDRQAKKRIRQITGQTPLEADKAFIREDKALTEKFRAMARAARKAASEQRKADEIKYKKQIQEALKDVRQRRLETEERRKIIKNMKKIKTRLPKMPPQFAKPIKEFLDSINLTSLSDAKRESLIEIKEMLESNELAPENVLSRQELAELDRLGRSNAKDFTLDELRQIHDAVRHYAKLASEFNRIKVEKRKLEMQEALEILSKELKPEKEFSDNIIKTQKGVLEKALEKGESIIDLFVHDQKAPDALLEAMAGKGSLLYDVFFRQINNGAKKGIAYQQEARDLFVAPLEGFAKRNNINNPITWIRAKVQVNLGNGRILEMTREERMSFYRHSLNPDNRRAIINELGGAGFKSSAEFKNKPLKLTESDLNSIIGSLTPAELEFSGLPVKGLFEHQGNAIGEVYNKKNDLELETLENYFPKEVLPREREAGDLDTDFQAEKFANKFLRIGIEKGMTKARVDSKKAVYISGLTYEINKSINRAASYIGLEIPISNAARLLYNKDFQNMLDSRYGPKVRRYLDKYLRDVAGEMSNYDSIDRAANIIKNNLSVAYLGISPFVMAKQVASLPLYSIYIEPKYLLEASIKSAAHPIETKNKHVANSPYYRARLEGSSERDVADVFKSQALRKLIPDSGKTLKEWSMSGIQLFDLAAVTPGMEAGYLKVMDEFQKGKLSGIVKETLNIEDNDIESLTPDKKIALAYEFAEWVTEKTQPQFASQFRSQLSRGNTAAKMLTMFGSFTNRAYNLLGSTYAQARRTNSKQDWAIFARTAFTVLVMNTALVLSIDRLRDKLYNRESQELWRAILTSWSGYVFLLRDATRAALAENYFQGQLRTPVLSWAQGGIEGTRKLIEYLEDGDEADLAKSIDKGSEFILSGFGVPYRMIKKLLGIDTKKKERRL